MFIKNMIFGAIIGLANIIPGVSGGTMAVVLNIYDKLINSISNIKKHTKESILFLIPIVVGAVLAILLLSKGLTYLLDHHYMVTNFFFIGVIFGSIPMIFKRATADGFKILHVIPFLVTLLMMLAMVFLSPDEAAQTVTRDLSVFSFIRVMVCSAVAAVCMIIPGISGSFVMLLLGVYTTVITAISEFNILMLVPIGIGVLLGLIFGAKLIDFVLKKFPQATYFAILGFVIGSIPVMFGKIIASGSMRTGAVLAVAIVVLVIGVGITLMFDSEKFKGYFEEKNSNKLSEDSVS